MNIDVIARIRPALKTSERSALSVTGTRVQSSDGTGHIFSDLHKAETQTHDIFKGSCLELLDLLLSGYNVSIVAFGESNSGKTFTLGGERSNKSGLIPLLVSALFTKLADDQRSSRDRTISERKKISIQMYEVYNEKVKDLLAPAYEDNQVDVDEDATSGAHIRGITVRQPADGSDCTNIFKQGWDNRTTGTTDYGSIESKATIFLQLEVAVVPSHRREPFYSKLLVVKLPGAEKLSEDPGQLQMREGPTLNKAIVALGDVITDLANTNSPNRVINYGESKVTQLLRDTFGGNSKTMVLVTLPPSETPSLPSVLQTAGLLAQIQNYPIVNDRYAKSLICQYQALLLELSSQVPGTPGQGDGSDVRDQLQQLARANAELQERCDIAQARLQQEQARYNDLMSSKTQLSSKLVLSEEEKLQISKTLVDLQLENNRIQEEAETKSFEATNKILILENEVRELQLRLDMGSESVQSVHQRLADVEKERKDLAQEYIVLKTNHITLTEDYQEQLRRNDELGLELVTLANSMEKMKHERDGMEIEKTREYYDRLRNLVGRFSRQSVTEKGDLSRSVVSLQSEKLELEKQLFKSKARRNSQMDLMKDEHNKVLTSLEDKLSSLHHSLVQTKKDCREYQQKLAEKEAELITVESERKNFEEAYYTLDIQLKELIAEYCNRLQQYVHDLANYSSELNSRGQQPTTQNVRAFAEAMVRDIKVAHEKKAKMLEKEIQDVTAKRGELVKKHEKLLAAYRLSQMNADKGLDYSTDGFLPADEEFRSLQDKTISDLRRKLSESEKTIVDLREKLNKPDSNANKYEYGNLDKPTTIEMGWGALRRELREFTLNTQQDLEKERAALLTRCVIAEEQVLKLQSYIDGELKRYQEENVRLKKQVGRR